MKILLCTNGSTWANRALEIGGQIALQTASFVDVLAVARDAERLAKVIETITPLLDDFEAQGISTTLHRRTGGLADQVIEQAHAAPYDLVVIGSRGRRGIKRLFLGSVAVHVMEHAPTSVLVVKGRQRGLNRFLVCSAAGPTSQQAVRFTGRLAQALEASVTLVHVMSQIALTDQAILADLEAPADDLIDRGSREGVHLHEMIDLLAAEGIKARAVVRHGLVLDELIAEAREGQFDLLAIGAHITPGISSLLVGDLSQEILLAVDRPVLIVRQLKPEP